MWEPTFLVEVYVNYDCDVHVSGEVSFWRWSICVPRQGGLRECGEVMVVYEHSARRVESLHELLS